MSKGKTFKRRRGTTAIPNRTVFDEGLSYAALGLLTVLLARPDTAPQGYRDLQGRGMGKEATMRALRELNEGGYRHQLRVSFGRGQMVTHTVISEEPMTETEARDWLETTALRGAETRARIDQRKHGIPAGRIMRGISDPDPSDPDNPAHISLERDPRLPSLRSGNQGDPSVHARDDVQELTGMPDWMVQRFLDEEGQA